MVNEEYAIMRQADFEQILTGLDQLNERLTFISLSCKIPETINIADIVKIKGISRTQIIEKERYLLPNFGVSQYPDGPTRWDYKVYEKWNSRPISDRKNEFEKYLENERKMRQKDKTR